MRLKKNGTQQNERTLHATDGLEAAIVEEAHRAGNE